MADPGFPRGGGANSGGGAPTYDFAKFSQKLHEIETILTRGARPKFYYVDPPLQWQYLFKVFEVSSVTDRSIVMEFWDVILNHRK